TNSPQGSTATTAGYNVFQGLVNGNSVTFYGVPVLTPPNGLARVFRIANVRTDATGQLPDNQAPPVFASITMTGAGALPLYNSNPTAGFVQPGLTATVVPN